MALEAAIRENTAALHALLDQLRGSTVPPGVLANHGKGVSAPKPEIQNSPPEAAEAVELNYERDVKPLALKLIAKDKPAWLRILEGHQVSKGPELTDLATALEQIKAALRG